MASSRGGLPGAAAASRPVGTARRLARQRRPGWIAGGVALLALAVLANVYVFRASSHRITVVRVARDVAIGRQITRADLDTTNVAEAEGVATVPSGQLTQVVGRRAAVDLVHGTLLTARQVTTQLTPQPGQALVTVGLKPSVVPPSGLPPGSRVRIAFTNGGQDAPDAQGGQAGDVRGGQNDKDVPAVIDETGGPDADGAVTVSLLVADADASAVAREATAGRLALVITSRGG